MKCAIVASNIAEGESCGNNMSGVTGIYFCPKKDVATINVARPATVTTYAERVVVGTSALATKAITCATGKYFAKMYCADDLGELKYTPQGQHGSKSFKAELEVFHPQFKADILGFLAVHNNEELIVVCQLNNDTYHLLGNIHRGVRLADSTNATSGKAVTDANGAECHFEWNCDAMQVMYEGWSPEDDTTGLPLVPAPSNE